MSHQGHTLKKPQRLSARRPEPVSAQTLRRGMPEMPKYLRLIRLLCEKYQKAPLDMELPPIRSLASEYKVCNETMARAMRNLSAMGLVQSRQGSGTRIIKSLAAGLDGVMRASLVRAGSSGLPAGAVRSIGLVLIQRKGLPPPTEHFFETDIVAGLQHGLADAGYSLASIIINEKTGYGMEKQLLNNPTLRGCVFMIHMLDRPSAIRVSKWEHPAVVINEDRFSDLIASVIADEEHGVQEAVEYLAKLGHCRIAFAWPRHPAMEPRKKGYVRGMETVNLPLDSNLIFEINLNEYGRAILHGAQLADMLLQQHPDCTAAIGL